MMINLHWLPEVPDLRKRILALDHSDADAWGEALKLAKSRLNFNLTNALDDAIHRCFEAPPAHFDPNPSRLAILASSTVSHLHGAIRIGALRRNIWVQTYASAFGQYLQELSDSSSPLYEFRPTAILLSIDGHNLAAGIDIRFTASETDNALAELETRLVETWRLARNAFHCPIIQQTAVPLHLPVLGNNEHRLSGSRHRFLQRLNNDLRSIADSEGVELLAVDTRVAIDGLSQWHDRALWHRSKQEISPTAAPLYGDMVARILAAKKGRSSKCLVMDLDNTIWGGVVGDDGVEGLVLGQGSALGEAYTAFQSYARDLGRRGVILAVCSKNDERNALEPFHRHPDMVINREDISSFIANWSDKANNIRSIGTELNIGLDAMVFLDDNPFERELIRRELPMVEVPEVSDDPTDYPAAISDAGYFEGLVVTNEDMMRSVQYRENRKRNDLKTSGTDLESYLRSLDMRLTWSRFDRIGLPRIVQLINKSNQFNLTTRRYTENEALAVMSNPDALGLQLRLADKFGDNGVIAIVIGRLSTAEVYIDTWLMSCRVLGRQVEQATLNILAQEAIRLGAKALIGEYVPTSKNKLVREHYQTLGFCELDTLANGSSRHRLDLQSFRPLDTYIEVIAG